MDISTNDVFTLFMCLCLQLLSLGSTAFISRILGQAARLRLLSLSWAGILLMILTYVYAYTYTYIYIHTRTIHVYVCAYTHIIALVLFSEETLEKSPGSSSGCVMKRSPKAFTFCIVTCRP